MNYKKNVKHLKILIYDRIFWGGGGVNGLHYSLNG